jgi:hypothetical protein
VSSLPGRLAGRVTGVRVDERGIHAVSLREVVLDVSFDGRRIWSFWLHRDGVREGRRPGRGHLVPWPSALAKFLDGRTRLTLAVHGSGQLVYDAEIHLGTSADRIAVVDAEGSPLALDKSLRRVKTFENRTPEQVAPLMSAIEEVLAALAKAGVEGFLAYGTLLGAVRNGALIGHDSDADLGYVSAHEHPIDMMLESFRLQRALCDMGYPTTRYSGGAFKVDVREADGSVRGLDVFGGFVMSGYLYLMGEIRTPFQREWIYPLGTATLEGHTFPVPADTDRFLVATYGPDWRTPDPAFKFTTPRTTHRRLNGWFRGIRVSRGSWDGRYSAHPAPPDLEPSAFVQWVAEREKLGVVTATAQQTGTTLIDLGCGWGVDAHWVAGQGVTAFGLDHAPKAFEHLAAQSAAEDLPVHYLPLNLLELRSALSAGALLANRPGRRVLTARHLVDALDTRGRENLFRTAQMMLRDGGRLYLEFLTRRGDDQAGGPNISPIQPKRVRAELMAAGLRVVHRELLLASPGGARRGASGDHPGSSVGSSSQLCRMVAQWDR